MSVLPPGQRLIVDQGKIVLGLQCWYNKEISYIVVGKAEGKEDEMVGHVESTVRKQKVGREYVQALKSQGLP